MTLSTLLYPNRKFIFLSRMQVAGSFRSLFRLTFTLPGLYAVLILAAFVVPFFLDKATFIHWFSKMLFIFGPLTLSLMILYAIRVGVSGTFFYFSPAETNFLMTAAFSKEELLSYKFSQYNFGALIIIAASCAHLTDNLTTFLFRFVEFYFIILGILLIPLVISSFVSSNSRRGRDFLRTSIDLLFTIVLVSVVATIFLRLIGNEQASYYSGLVFRYLIFPVDQFLVYFASASVEKAWKGYAALVTFDLLLLGCFLFRSSKIEIESIFYKNIQQHAVSAARLRGHVLSASSIDLSWFPDFHPAKGMGALFWVKCVEHLRSYRNLLFLFSLLTLGFASLTVFYMNSRADFDLGSTYVALQVFYHIQIIGLITLLFSGFPDFRSEADRLEFLFSLPISRIRITFGYVMLPTLILAGYMATLGLIGFSILEYYFPQYPSLSGLFVALSLILPTAFLFVVIDNIVFLMFPVQSEIKGKLIGKALIQFLAVTVTNLVLAWAVGRAHDRFLTGSVEASSPYVYFTLWSLVVLISASTCFFLLLAWRLRTFDVSRFSG